LKQIEKPFVKTLITNILDIREFIRVERQFYQIHALISKDNDKQKVDDT